MGMIEVGRPVDRFAPDISKQHAAHRLSLDKSETAHHQRSRDPSHHEMAVSSLLIHIAVEGSGVADHVCPGPATCEPPFGAGVFFGVSEVEGGQRVAAAISEPKDAYAKVHGPVLATSEALCRPGKS